LGVFKQRSILSKYYSYQDNSRIHFSILEEREDFRQMEAFRMKWLLQLKILAILSISILISAACQSTPEIPHAQVIPDGDADRGQQAFVDYGCTACHTIPRIQGFHGNVGPPLENWGSRQLIAGQFPNNAQNLVSWLMAPQAMIPGSGMPDMGVTWQDAKDMSAYLFTLRDRR
jgi:cytochrome c